MGVGPEEHNHQRATNPCQLFWVHFMDPNVQQFGGIA